MKHKLAGCPVQRGLVFVHLEALVFECCVVVTLFQCFVQNDLGLSARWSQFACPNDSSILQDQGNADLAEVFRRVWQGKVLFRFSCGQIQAAVAGKTNGIRQFFHGFGFLGLLADGIGIFAPLSHAVRYNPNQHGGNDRHQKENKTDEQRGFAGTLCSCLCFEIFSCDLAHLLGLLIIAGESFNSKSDIVGNTFHFYILCNRRCTPLGVHCPSYGCVCSQYCIEPLHFHDFLGSYSWCSHITSWRLVSFRSRRTDRSS